MLSGSAFNSSWVDVPLGDKIKVKLVKTKTVSGPYTIHFIINGEVKSTQMRLVDKTHTNVKCYISSPNMKSAPVKISNLRFKKIKEHMLYLRKYLMIPLFI